MIQGPLPLTAGPPCLEAMRSVVATCLDRSLRSPPRQLYLASRIGQPLHPVYWTESLICAFLLSPWFDVFCLLHSRAVCSCSIVISFFFSPSIEHRDCSSPLLPHLFSNTPPIQPILYPFAASFLPLTHTPPLHSSRHWLLHHQRSGPPYHAMPCHAFRTKTRLGVHNGSHLIWNPEVGVCSQSVSGSHPPSFILFLVFFSER